MNAPGANVEARMKITRFFFATEDEASVLAHDFPKDVEEYPEGHDEVRLDLTRQAMNFMRRGVPARILTGLRLTPYGARSLLVRVVMGEALFDPEKGEFEEVEVHVPEDRLPEDYVRAIYEFDRWHLAEHGVASA
jgi:hypothetical protein